MTLLAGRSSEGSGLTAPAAAVAATAGVGVAGACFSTGDAGVASAASFPLLFAFCVTQMLVFGSYATDAGGTTDTTGLVDCSSLPVTSETLMGPERDLRCIW